jgi:hypothetical protein
MQRDMGNEKRREEWKERTYRANKWERKEKVKNEKVKEMAKKLKEKD